MRKESPEERQRRVEAAFTAKVEVLEAWAKSGVPDGAEVPTTHAGLRRWRGTDGTLETWADPLVDRPRVGKYPDLTARYANALEAISTRLSKTGKRGEADAEAAFLRLDNDRLRLQNADLLGQVDLHQRRIALLESLLRAAGQEVPS